MPGGRASPYLQTASPLQASLQGSQAANNMKYFVLMTSCAVTPSHVCTPTQAQHQDQGRCPKKPGVRQATQGIQCGGNHLENGRKLLHERNSSGFRPKPRLLRQNIPEATRASHQEGGVPEQASSDGQRRMSLQAQPLVPGLDSRRQHLPSGQR